MAVVKMTLVLHRSEGRVLWLRRLWFSSGVKGGCCGEGDSGSAQE